MRSRLTDLEKQIAEQKVSSGQMLLAEAEEELASVLAGATETAGANRRGPPHRAFSKNFGAYKAMEQELAQIEASRSGLSERLLRTETSERSRMPSVQVIEAATAPQDAWRPDYLRDAGISLGAAIVLALGAMALVEVFNRPPPPSTAPVIVPQSWIAVGQDVSPAPGCTPQPVLNAAASPGLLPNALDLPRELSQNEVARLLQTMPANDAGWAALLCGATPDEIRRIAAGDLDAASGTVALQLAPPRAGCVSLRESSARSPATAASCPARTRKWRDNCSAPPTMPGSTTLRRSPRRRCATCIAYLVGQGLRFADLDRIVGPLPADVLAGYAGFAPPGQRRKIEEIDPVMPALRMDDMA